MFCMKKISIYILFMLCSLNCQILLSLPNDRGVAFGLLGAPGSGKKEAKEAIEKNIKLLAKIRPSLEKDGQVDLTLDGINKGLVNLPLYLQFDLFIKTFNWLSDLKTAYPKVYSDWWDEFIVKSFVIWEKAFSKYGISIKKFNIKGHSVLKINGKSKLDESSLKNLFKSVAGLTSDKLWNNNNDKNLAFLYLDRYLQYHFLFEALHAKKAIFFDEKGLDFNAIKDQLSQIHNDKYVIILLFVQSDFIGSNYINNILNLIENPNKDDFGGFIVNSYYNLKQSLPFYKKNTEDKGWIEISDLQDLFKNNKVVATINNTTTKDDLRLGNKPIDIFIRLKSDSIEKVNKLAIDKLKKMAGSSTDLLSLYKEFFKVLIYLQSKIYLENPKDDALKGIKDKSKIKLELAADSKQLMKASALGIGDLNIKGRVEGLRDRLDKFVKKGQKSVYYQGLLGILNENYKKYTSLSSQK